MSMRDEMKRTAAPPLKRVRIKRMRLLHPGSQRAETLFHTCAEADGAWSR